MKKSIIFVLILFLFLSGEVEARRNHQDFFRKPTDVKQQDASPTKQPDNPPSPTPTKVLSPFWFIPNDQAVREFLNEPVDNFKASPSVVPTHGLLPTGQVKGTASIKVESDYLYFGILLMIVVFFLYRLKKPTL